MEVLPDVTADSYNEPTGAALGCSVDAGFPWLTLGPNSAGGFRFPVHVAPGARVTRAWLTVHLDEDLTPPQPNLCGFITHGGVAASAEAQCAMAFFQGFVDGVRVTWESATLDGGLWVDSPDISALLNELLLDEQYACGKQAYIILRAGSVGAPPCGFEANQLEWADGGYGARLSYTWSPP